MKNDLTVEHSDGQVRVSVHGALSFMQLRPVRRAFHEALARSRPLVFDLAQTRRVDATGLAIVLHTREVLEQKGLPVTIQNAPPEIRTALRLLFRGRHSSRNTREPVKSRRPTSRIPGAHLTGLRSPRSARCPAPRFESGPLSSS